VDFGLSAKVEIGRYTSIMTPSSNRVEHVFSYLISGRGRSNRGFPPRGGNRGAYA